MKKQYKEMNNDEKAQAIFDFMKTNSTVTIGDTLISLSDLLMDLSFNYSNGAIFTVDDWLDYEKDMDLVELIKTAQQSKGLNINDDYIRESIYYDGYQTANNVIDLVDNDEAIDWICNALNNTVNVDITIGQLDNLLKSIPANEKN